MATNGTKFLKLSQTTEFVISAHAMDRLKGHLGFPLTNGLAATMFRRSRQVKPDEMFLLGYRPAYSSRLRQGTKSWYFLFRVFGQELVAVIGEGEETGQMVWVTTYAPNRQTEYFRVMDCQALGVA